jgi:CheY-like chemotaxis protein
VNQKVAVKMLERLGYRADVAANGLEVLEALSRIPYSAVLMDVQMPEMDGYEATAENPQREEGQEDHTPIIAMTANAMQGDRGAGFRGGDGRLCLQAGKDRGARSGLGALDLTRRRGRKVGTTPTLESADTSRNS